MFALKTTFSCSHSSGRRWKRQTNFPVNSTLMVAMLVKLLFLIVSNASPATSFEGRFSRSKYALCCCSDLLGLSAYLRLTEILLGVQQLFLGLSENISARHLQRVLEYGLLYGLFTRFWWMIANQQRISRCHIQWQSETYFKQSHRCSCNYPHLNEFCDVFWPTPYFLFLRWLFSLSKISFLYVFNCQDICSCLGRHRLNPPCLRQKADLYFCLTTLL